MYVPGMGLVVEPGFSCIVSIPGRGEIIIPPVSVCHQVSTIGHADFPIVLKYQRQTSGFIGSPAVPKSRRLERSKEFDKYSKAIFYSSVDNACLKSDLIIIHTEWNEFKLLEFKKIVKKSNFKIFDMRNLYSSKLMKKNKINYFGIGK